MSDPKISQAVHTTFKVVLTLVLIVTLAGVIFLVGCSIFIYSEISSAEELVMTSDSPDGTYTVKFYLLNGGATTAYGVKATVTDNTSKKPKERKIYLQYRTDSTDIEWEDEYTAVINRNVKLDVRYDSYDYRNGDMMKYPTSFIGSSESPEREYVIRFYRYDGIGEKNRLRAEAVNTKDGTKRDIYYVYTEGYGKREVEWLSEYEVKLNGEQLDVRYDEFIEVDN